MSFTEQPQTQIIWLHEDYLIIIIVVVVVIIVIVIIIVVVIRTGIGVKFRRRKYIFSDPICHDGV